MNAYHRALLRRLCIQRACDARLPFFVTEWWSSRSSRYCERTPQWALQQAGLSQAPACHFPWIDWGSIGARQQLGIGPPLSGSMSASAAYSLWESV